MPATCRHLFIEALLFLGWATMGLAGGSCNKKFFKFLYLADAYWRHKDVSGLDFARAIGDVVQVSNDLSEGCRLAMAVAHVLSAELVVWLSRPFAAELPTSKLRYTYDEAVWAYVRGHTARALHLLYQDAEQARLAYRMGGGKLGRLVQVFNDSAANIAGTIAISAQKPVGPVARQLQAVGFGKDYEDEDPAGWSPYAAAILDRQWGEVFVPALPLDAGPWTYVEAAGGIPSYWPQLEAMSTPQLVEHLETALRRLLDASNALLRTAVSLGIIRAYWARSSTLIALLRYGALFGHFTDEHHDCVDDDLDFTIQLPADSTGAWPRFVNEAYTMQEKGCKCFMGAEAQALARSSGRYEQLLCLCISGSFLLPVSFERFPDSTPTPDLGVCYAYDDKVPCPSDVEAHLAKYGGCPALPNVGLAALTVGNACVKWMEVGIPVTYVAAINRRARILMQAGFLSMMPILRSSLCTDLEIGTEDRVLGNKAVGEDLPDGGVRTRRKTKSTQP